MPVHTHQQHNGHASELSIRPQFGLELEEEVPRLTMPASGMAPQTAYQIIHDELMLDGNARLNLATFVTTWMEPEAERLMVECSPKNMIDKDEYPQ
ncbi:MAG TPA: glutamate decarboxylase, partial [Acidimicrobiales bacterium]|nr:glutamate decarboxylase [Acidimicrobiales bacterium]